MPGITKPMIRKIYAAGREAGLDNDALHALVYARTGREHISELTKAQASVVIDELERLLGRGERSAMVPMGPEGKPRPLKLATKRQLWLIQQLAGRLGWENPRRLRGFIRKYARVEDLRWLPYMDAQRIIEGLKAMVARQEGGGVDGAGQG